MRHVEEKVILAKEDLLAVVVELRHALGANHNESLIVETKFTLGQCPKVLHHHQIVTIAYSQGIVTTSWYECFYLHDVRFFLFKVQNSQKIFDIQCSIFA